MVVDPHRAELQRARRAHRAADVARPHRRGEAVVDAVRPGERLVLVVEPLHRHDGAEDLALHDLGVLADARDDRRLDEEAGGRPVPPPASTSAPPAVARSRKPSTRSCCAAETTGPISMSSSTAGRRTRSAYRRLERRRAGRRASAAPASMPRRRGAVLAGVVEAGVSARPGHGLDVGVVEHDHRRLAAELEVHPLERCGGRAGDLLAGGHSPVSETMRTAGWRTSAAPAGSPSPVIDVEHAGRAGSPRISSHQPQQRERGLLGRLEHDGVAGGERGADLPDRHHQRVVPRGDLADTPIGSRRIIEV